jgi:hypothetical protein
LLTGTLVSNAVIVPPSGVTKWYVIVNNCVMGSYGITFAPSLGATVSLRQGAQMVWTDGTNGYPALPTLDQVPLPTGAVSLNSQKIINLATPTLATDGATKGYIDTKTLDTFAVPVASVSFNGQRITGLGSPTLATDAVSKGYVDATAFAPVLPGQAGNAGKFVTTDGVNASWASIPPSPVGAITSTALNFGAF